MLWLCLLSSLLFLPVPWVFLRGLALGWVWQSQGRLPGITARILLRFGGASSPAQHPSSLPTGIEKFKGSYLHSRDYKDAQDYNDKRVVVIGIGNSGSDLAVEISQKAKQVSSSSGVPWWHHPQVGHRRLGTTTSTRTPIFGGVFGVPTTATALRR